MQQPRRSGDERRGVCPDNIASAEAEHGEHQMKPNVALTIASLLSILLFVFHLTDDIMHGFEPGVASQLPGMVGIPVVLLYGTLMLSERRSGYIIMFLGSLFSLVVPVVHMKGKGVGVTSSIGHSSGHFFFVWTMIAIGVTGLFSVILSARGLWSLPWRRSR